MVDWSLVVILLFVTVIVVVSLIAWLISEKIKQTTNKNSLIHDEGFMLALREYKEKTEHRLNALESEVFVSSTKSTDSTSRGTSEADNGTPENASNTPNSPDEVNPSES